MTTHESVVKRPTAKEIARSFINDAPGERSDIRSKRGNGQRHSMGSEKAPRGTSRRKTAGSDSACIAKRREKGPGRDRGIAAHMTATGCSGAQEWDSILESSQESQSS